MLIVVLLFLMFFSVCRVIGAAAADECDGLNGYENFGSTGITDNKCTL